MEHNASSRLLQRFEKPVFELKDHPIKRGIDWKWLPTLADLVYRKIPTRERAEQITGFVNNGLGAQFAAVGARVYKNARAKELGRELPIDWFTQDVYP
jgi:ornithine cyclodeaminase/alanine dehydrogenase-like protein (mu-crystallin family)